MNEQFIELFDTDLVRFSSEANKLLNIPQRA